jgi:hypothetical protein
MTPLTTIEPTLPTGPSPTGTPAAVNDNAIGLVLPPIPANEPARPLHTKTESTLAPTSEFVRYFLLAYPSRYLFRGLFGLLTGEDKINELSPLSQRIRHNIHEFGRGFYDRIMPGVSHRDRFAVSYNAALGIGSTALTTSYGWMVYKDIKNIFSEAVAAEKGKRPEELTYKDFANSDNRILQQTMRNFKTRFAMRFLTDLPFFGAAWLRDTTAGDFMLGLKAVQLLADTW